MKKRNLLVLSLVAMASITLSSCQKNENVTSVSQATESTQTETVDPTTQSSAGQNTTSAGNTTSTNSNTTNNTTEDNQGEVIFVQTVPHVTITASKKTAKAGETINLTVNVDDGYVLKSITVNGTPISGTSFIMPAGSAYVVGAVDAINVASGMKLTGDISEVLVKDNTTGIYAAKGVKVAVDSKVAYSINGQQLSVTKVDNAKTFADIKVPSSNIPGFTIAGGATYDFFYDPTNNETPCYVRRTEINELPQSAKALESLFSGQVGSTTCVYPEGVTKVEYTSTERNDRYVWELYSDDSSLATVQGYTNPNLNRGVVYKSIDNNVYTVVDSYVENHDGHCITYVERDDSKRFSARYDVVSSLTYGNKKYQKTLQEAKFDANLYSHTMESIDFDIMYAYRTGFKNDISDDVYTSDIKVTSTKNVDGTFETKIKSWVSVKAVSSGAAATAGASYHNEFDVTIKFSKSGALMNLDYNEDNYSANQYDVENGKFLNGSKGYPNNNKHVTCAYTYGEKKAGKPQFDTSEYFISSIDNVKIVNSKGEDAVINRMDTVEVFQEASSSVGQTNKYVTFDYAPERALDFWQYGIVASSDRAVVNHKSNDPVQYPYDFVGYGEGTATLTIGNHTMSSGVKKDFQVTVPKQDNNIKSVFAYSVPPYSNDNWVASSGQIYAGSTDKVKLTATLTSNAYDHFPTLDVVSSNSELLKVEYNREDGYLYLDASGATSIQQNTSVTLTVNAAYAAGYGPVKLSVTILPAPHLLETVVGTWDLYDPNGTIASKGFTASLSFLENGKGSLVAVDGKDTYKVEFDYTFDKGKQYIKATNVKAYKNNQQVGLATDLKFDIDCVKTGYIGVYCGISLSYSYGDTDGNLNVNLYELLGSANELDDELGTEYKFEDFAPKK